MLMSMLMLNYAKLMLMLTYKVCEGNTHTLSSERVKDFELKVDTISYKIPHTRSIHVFAGVLNHLSEGLLAFNALK